MWVVIVVARLPLLLLACALSPAFMVINLLIHGRERSAAGDVFASLADVFGGGYCKLGQLVAMRGDLFQDRFRASFAFLLDRGKYRPRITVSTLISRYQIPVGYFCVFTETPMAAGCIAQIHRAQISRTSQQVVVKIVGDRTAKILAFDIGLIKLMLRVLSVLPVLKGIPIRTAFDLLAHTILVQTDLQEEARFQEKIIAAFRGQAWIWIPKIVGCANGTSLLVTEYIENLRQVNDPSLNSALRAHAVTSGLKFIYECIFCLGFVYCDPHRGNILVAQDGRLVIVDFGMVALLDATNRRAFARFFLSIRTNDVKQGIDVVLATAKSVPVNLDRDSLVQDMQQLFSYASGKKAREFSVSVFAANLFVLLAKHGVEPSIDFTFAIVSLAVYEGTIKEQTPDLDFQTIAVPYIIRALSP